MRSEINGRKRERGRGKKRERESESCKMSASGAETARRRTLLLFCLTKLEASLLTSKC